MMSTRHKAFLEALDALCIEHGCCLTIEKDKSVTVFFGSNLQTPPLPYEKYTIKQFHELIIPSPPF